MVLFVRWFIKCTFCRRHGLELTLCKLKLERRGEGSLHHHNTFTQTLLTSSWFGTWKASIESSIPLSLYKISMTIESFTAHVTRPAHSFVHNGKPSPRMNHEAPNNEHSPSTHPLHIPHPSSTTSLHPPDHPSSHQIPIPLPTLTLQRLLAHPRRIKPTRLKLRRRASILIIKPNHRLMGFISLPITGKSLDRVWTTGAARWIVATTARDRSRVPGGQG